MTSKESFDKLHEIEVRMKNWETLEERDEMEKEREQAIKNLVPEVGLNLLFRLPCRNRNTSINWPQDSGQVQCYKLRGLLCRQLRHFA